MLTQQIVITIRPQITIGYKELFVAVIGYLLALYLGRIGQPLRDEWFKVLATHKIPPV
jgi:hypothetical protein